MKRNIMIALLIIVSATTHAQSLKDLFSKDNIKNAIETVVDKATGKEMSVTGTWTYEKCKIEFESDNFLQKAGGAIAATKLEEELDGILQKIGIEQGKMSYTFNSDSTFSSKSGKIQSRGTYSINQSTGEMSLKMVGGLLKSNCTLKVSGSTMDMLYDADKLLSIITAISGATDSKMLDSVSGLLGKYDGLKIGMHMTKTE